MSRAITEELEKRSIEHHIGTTLTTNKRFWEFNEEFVGKLKNTKAQAYEMECATLFTASYKRKFTLGALLLISDLPLERNGVKTKESSAYIFKHFMPDQIEKGVAILKRSREMQELLIKGAYHRNIGMGHKLKEQAETSQ